eukprot:1059660-Pleurochrysis_carterae.AAC.1
MHAALLGTEVWLQGLFPFSYDSSSSNEKSVHGNGSRGDSTTQKQKDAMRSVLSLHARLTNCSSVAKRFTSVLKVDRVLGVRDARLVGNVLRLDRIWVAPAALRAHGLA